MFVFITDLLIKSFIGALFWSFISAYILQLATKWQLKFKPKYFESYKIVFFSTLAIVLLNLFIGFMISAPTASAMGTRNALLSQGKASLLSIIVSFFLQGYIYGKYIKHPEKGAIGFNNGATIAINQIIIVALAIGVIFGVYVIYDKL